MLDAGNPYVLPSVIVGAVAYLGVTVLTDASLLVRIGLLIGIVGVVPIVVNRLRPGGAETGTSGGTAAKEVGSGGGSDESTGDDSEATERGDPETATNR